MSLNKFRVVLKHLYLGKAGPRLRPVILNPIWDKKNAACIQSLSKASYPSLSYDTPKRHLLTSELTNCTSTAQVCAYSKVSNSRVHDEDEGKESSISADSVKDEKFDIVYKFPHIVLARAISRLKLYQTGITVVLLPPMIYFYSTGYVDLASLKLAVGVTSLAGVMLYVMSSFFRRLVGLIGLNGAEDIVRISHLTFWGNRRDIYVPITDVVPLSELPDKPSDIYIVLRRYSTDIPLYITLKYGSFPDKEKLEKILGQIK